VSSNVTTPNAMTFSDYEFMMFKKILIKLSGVYVCIYSIYVMIPVLCGL